MPDILDVAIGSVFIFLLFSLVVSALNEVILSSFDQRAKFLRLGLAELFGTTVRVQPGFLTFLKKLWNGIWSLGGLLGGGREDLGTYGNALLQHGLVNAFSRSDNGGTSPSYIPAGAFVTGLLDVVSKVPASSTGPAGHAGILTAFIDAIQGAIAAPPITQAVFNTALTRFTNPYAALAPAPATGTAIETLSRRVADAAAKAGIQTKLLAAPDFVAVATILADPSVSASLRSELKALVEQSNGNPATFRTAVTGWYSPAAELDALQKATLAALSSLLAPTIEHTAATIEASLNALPDSKLKESLLSLFRTTGQDVQKFKVAVEGWFNGIMDRVSGWYKRFSQKWMLVIGFILAVVINVDSIEIIRVLSNNPNLAKAVAIQAEAFAKDNRPPLPADELAAAREQKRKALDDAKTNLKKLEDSGEKDAAKLKVAQDAVAAAEAAADPLKDYQNAVTKLTETGLPIGWSEKQLTKIGLGQTKTSLNDIWTGVWQIWLWREKVVDFFSWLSQNFSALLPMLAGWFLSAIAASLGASFWFDLLGRFTNIRAAGKPPGEKDATSTAIRPPPANLDTTPGTRQPAN